MRALKASAALLLLLIYFGAIAWSAKNNPTLCFALVGVVIGIGIVTLWFGFYELFD